MRLRQAKKIMNNVRLYRGMIWVYGSGRVDKANIACADIIQRKMSDLKQSYSYLTEIH